MYDWLYSMKTFKYFWEFNNFTRHNYKIKDFRTSYISNLKVWLWVNKSENLFYKYTTDFFLSPITTILLIHLIEELHGTNYTSENLCQFEVRPLYVIW